MNRDKILELVKQAGGKVFHDCVVICDHKASGDGTEFVHKFAELVLGEQDDNSK